MENYIVEEFTTEDLSRIPSINPPDWKDISPHFIYYLISDFCFPVKLVFNGKLVGTGSAIIHNDAAWLAHIIVHPDHRNKGLGNMITKELLDIVATKNCLSVHLLATDLGFPVYKKQGFIEDTDYIIYKQPDSDFELDISEKIIGIKEKHKEVIRELDKQVSGEDRFFRLQEHFGSAKVYYDEDRIQGFYLPTFGEGLIIADNSVAGIALMQTRLLDNEIATLPVDNLEAIKFLKDLQFTPQRILKRMVLGEKRKWEPQNLYNRVGGYVG